MAFGRDGTSAELSASSEPRGIGGYLLLGALFDALRSEYRPIPLEYDDPA